MKRQRMMCLGWTWVQHVRNDGWKTTIGRTMCGECSSEDAGPGRGTEGKQNGGIKWGEACGVKEDATEFSLFVDLCFPCGHSVPGFSLLPFGNLPE